MRPLLALGAVAASTAVAVHGVVGDRWMRAQLRDLPPSELFGEPDVGRRVFAVTWHIVTALFAATAGTLALMALEVFDSREVLLVTAATYGLVLLVGLVGFARRLDAVVRPVPPVFALSMSTVVVTCLLAAR